MNDPGITLADDEIASQLRVIMFGGIETIQSGIMNTVLLLLRTPAALDAVRADPSLLDGAIEESLRLIPPVSFIERWTPRPVVLGGVAIGAGEFIGVSVLAANRDPDMFEHPLDYDITRENARRHLSFSFGEHFCLGAHLARIELRSALERVLALPGLRLVAADEAGRIRLPAAGVAAAGLERLSGLRDGAVTCGPRHPGPPDYIDETTLPSTEVILLASSPSVSTTAMVITPSTTAYSAIVWPLSSRSC